MSATVVTIAALKEERELGDIVRRMFDPTMSKLDTIVFLESLSQSEKELLNNDPADVLDNIPVYPFTGDAYLDETRDTFYFRGDIIPQPLEFTQAMLLEIVSGSSPINTDRTQETMHRALATFDANGCKDSGESS